MRYANKRERFPRAALARRVGRIMDELSWWREYYEREASITSSPAFEAKLRERASSCDAIWHELQDAETSFAWMS